MPVLPDVRQQYSSNLGSVIDTSGEEQNAKVYGAISQFSSQVGEFATQVARDTNIKAANLEKSQKLAKYDLDRQSLLDSMSRDPSLDFVNNSKQIEDDYRATLRSNRESILTNAQSGMAKEMMEQSLASAESEEAISLLKLKNEKINDALKIELNKAEEDYSSSLLSPNTNFNLANDNYKKTINRISSAYGNYYTPEIHQKYQQNIADIGAERSMNNMLMGGRTQEAAAQLLGSNYSLLLEHMKGNFKNGVDTYMGVGLRDETRPGYYKVHLPNGAIVDYDSKNEEQWKKSPYMLSKEFSRMSENVFIDSTPTNEVIRNSSSQTKARMYDSLFKALSNKPKQDKTLASRVVKEAQDLAKRGKIEDQHIQTMLSDEVIPNLNKAELVDSATTIMVSRVQELVKRSEIEKISDQEAILENIDNFLTQSSKNIENDPQMQKIATYLGDGDTDKGFQILKLDVLSKNQRDAYIKAAEDRRLQLKGDYEKDPVGTALKSLGETPQGRNIRQKLFAEGAIKKVNSLTNAEVNYLKSENEQVKSRMAKLSDAFGETTNVVDVDTEKALKKTFETSYSDTNELVGIIDNLKKIYGPRDFANLMNQVGQSHLAQALQDKNFEYIEDLSKATKWAAQYTRANNLNIDQLPMSKEVLTKLSESDDLQGYINVMLKGARSSQPLNAEAARDNAYKLTMFYMKDRGLSVEEASKLAVKRLVGDHNVILMQKPGKLFGGRDYSVIIDKSHKVSEDDLRKAFDDTLGNTDFLVKQHLMIPPELSKDKNGETYDMDRFLSEVTHNGAVINSDNGDGFVYGIIDKSTKRFIPLRNTEGDEIILPMREVKRVRDARLKLNTETSFTSRIMNFVFPRTKENSQNSTLINKNIAPSTSPVAPSTASAAPSTTNSTPIKQAPRLDDFFKNNEFEYRTLANQRSTEKFINEPEKFEVEQTMKFENQNMLKNFNTVYPNKKAITLGGALTADALKDVAAKRKMVLPSNLKTPKDIVEYFASTTKTKAQYDSLFKDYMIINRGYIREQLKGLPEYKKNTLADLSFVLGAGAVIKSKVADYLKDPNISSTAIIDYLKSSPVVSENLLANYFTSINGKMEPNRRLRSIFKWKN